MRVQGFSSTSFLLPSFIFFSEEFSSGTSFIANIWFSEH